MEHDAAPGSSPSARTLADLTPDPQNANRGCTRGREAVRQSLSTYGAGRGVLIDRAGRIIAGNKTVEEARALGLSLRVVHTDGSDLVAVQRDDLDLETDPQAKALGVADNRASELGLDWDSEQLRLLDAEGVDLSSFFTDAEFDAIVGTGAGADENAAIEPGPTDIQRGDLWLLGRHRLMCGDATSARDVGTLLNGITPVLMVTDPPYGVGYDPAWRHRVDPSQRTAVGTVTNDDRVDWTAALRRFPGDVAYVWHAGLHAATAATALEAAGFGIRSQIVWVKQHFALSRGHYHWAHEPAWYAVRTGPVARWHGDRTQTTVWEVPNLNPMGGTRDGDNAVTGHGTQKPVRLFEIPIQNHTTIEDAIFDPFCGSGTAIIAAEKTHRSCLALEIDPRYVQVAVTRWEAFTGQTATRIPSRQAEEGHADA